MKILKYKFSFLLFISVLIGYNLILVNSLKKYCSPVNKFEILSNFQNCSDSIINSNKNTSDLFENYNRILKMLENVLNSIESDQINKNETNHLILDIIKMVEIANSKPSLKLCFTHVCSLFKNCELPISIEYKNFENDASVATRLAALLTAISINENKENKTYLTKENLISLLKITVVDTENIYDSKIIFKPKTDNSRYAFHASKDYETKSNKLIFFLNMNIILVANF